MTNEEYLESLTPTELKEWFNATFEPKSVVSESSHAPNDTLELLAEIERLEKKAAWLEDENEILAEQFANAIMGWHESNRGWADALMRR